MALPARLALRVPLMVAPVVDASLLFNVKQLTLSYEADGYPELVTKGLQVTAVTKFNSTEVCGSR